MALHPDEMPKFNRSGSRRKELLSCLGGDSLDRLKNASRLVTLRTQQVLYEADDHISHIYFPETAVLCMLTIMKDGRTVESATVGSEGASWVSASFQTPTMPCQTMVAVGGTSYKIPASVIEDEIRRNGVFHNFLTEYSHALLISSLRTGACNALHTLSQRSARWLLLTLDRTTAEEFQITHDFLSALLGCSRTSLTTVLGELEQAGGIHTRRGRIELADRVSLKRSACECYGVIHHTLCTLGSRQKQSVLAEHDFRKA
jgi:CRP-like cAMP-binding protein